MTSTEYHVKRRAAQRRMYDKHGQWIGTADAEAAQRELNALDDEWRFGPEAQRRNAEAEAEYQRRHGRSDTYGT